MANVAHDPDHEGDRQQLPDLDPDVERDRLADEAGVRDAEVLQAGRESESVDEPEAEDDHAGPEEVIRATAQAEAGDEDDAERDHGVDGGRGDAPLEDGAGDQRQAVTGDEERDQLGGALGWPASNTIPSTNSR